MRDELIKPALTKHAVNPALRGALEPLRVRLAQIEEQIFSLRYKAEKAELEVAIATRFGPHTSLDHLKALRGDGKGKSVASSILPTFLVGQPSLGAVLNDHLAKRSQVAAPQYDRLLAALQQRVTELDKLIDLKETTAPIPLVPATFKEVTPATVAALCTPQALPLELTLLQVLTGSGSGHRSPCRACKGAGEVFASIISRSLGKQPMAVTLTDTARRGAEGAVWSYESDMLTHKEECYDDRMTAMLEASYMDGPGAVLHLTSSMPGLFEFVIDLKAMTEASVLTGVVRPIRRHASGTQPVLVCLTVPPKTAAGAEIVFTSPGGMKGKCLVPKGLKAGAKFHVRVDAPKKRPLFEMSELLKRELGVEGATVTEVVDAACALLGGIKATALIERARECVAAVGETPVVPKGGDPTRKPEKPRVVEITRGASYEHAAESGGQGGQGGGWLSSLMPGASSSGASSSTAVVATVPPPPKPKPLPPKPEMPVLTEPELARMNTRERIEMVVKHEKIELECAWRRSRCCSGASA